MKKRFHATAGYKYLEPISRCPWLHPLGNHLGDRYALPSSIRGTAHSTDKNDSTRSGYYRHKYASDQVVGLSIFDESAKAAGPGAALLSSIADLEASSAFSCKQSCLWSRREISLRTKGRVYQVVVPSIMF